MITPPLKIDKSTQVLRLMAGLNHIFGATTVTQDFTPPLHRMYGTSPFVVMQTFMGGTDDKRPIIRLRQEAVEDIDNFIIFIDRGS
jgi:hypothetical protein